MSTCTWAFLIGFAACILCGRASASYAVQSDCPLHSNDACDQWRFEQADKELTAIMESALAKIAQFASAETQQEATARLTEAHRQWLGLRENDCRAKAAFLYLRSARTAEGLTAACLAELTQRRVRELKEHYLLQ
jgi:uncharacterized protein YecT (DUF1311 family)